MVPIPGGATLVGTPLDDVRALSSVLEQREALAETPRHATAVETFFLDTWEVTNRQWRAYLSTEEDGKRGVSARDRIGNGPWYNAKGVLIAENLTELHLYNKTILKETAVNEKGGNT